MAKRGYKIQEFVAHSSNVNCLNIGKKACRLFITGGDDYKVNLWTIGKPTSLMSLSGHTSPVESVAFNTKEVLVLGGASSGVIRLWDLEEGKMVRTVAGHRSNCTAVEFHPFGEFFASGAMDTNLKLWDIRKKGCIHTYKGHSQGISTIKFTPDGHWVVSGGLDNVVKVWDLTAGKLLHDFNFHDGPIRSLDFHPLEFLLATGSADKTVKFWDLETFEMIGSARCEATGVRSIAFHPDGRTLFSGHEDGLKVFSWEPVICHDTVDMGWTTLGDLCIHDEKLLGCSFFRNSVGVWVADISLIEPYGDDLDLKKNEGTEQKHSLMESKLEKVEVEVAPTSGFRSMSPDESKEIKNIYIDSSGGKPIGLQRSGSVNSARVDLPEESKKICNLETTLKQNPATKGHVKSNEQATRKSFIEPNIVPRDIPAVKDSAKSGNETITFSKTKPGMLLRPAHIRRASTGRFDVDRFSDVNSGTFCDTASKLDSAKDPKFQSNPGSQNEVKESCEDKHPIKSVADDKFDKTISPYKFFNLVKRDGSSPSIEETSPVKYVNGVAVVRGRTRSLVERFERKEKVQINEDETNPSHPTINETGEKIHKDEDQNNGDQNNVPSTIFERRERITRDEDQNNVPSTMFERKEKITRDEDHNNVLSMPNTVAETRERVTPNEDQNNVPSIPSTVFESRERITCNEDQNNLPSIPSTIFERRERITRNEDQNNVPSIPSTVFESRERITRNEDQNNLPSSIPSTIFERRERITRNEDQNNAPSMPKATFDRRERIRRNEDRKNVPSIPNTIFERRERSPRNEDQKNVPSIPNTIFERRERIPRDEDQKNVPSIPNTIFERRERIPRNEDQKNVPSIPRTIIERRRERTLRNEDQKTAPSIPITISEIDKSPSILKFEAQASPRDSNSNSPNELGIIEALMQTHDVTLSTLRSRLTKLQVVRHFWERNDTKGAINALRKLSDQSVRANVISVLVEKMDVLTLDLVSSILPVLTGLLDGKIERHVKVSLDMLLKLVAVFGPTINATVSAPPSVGVDLHREQRRDCCNECFMQLQKVQTVLPILIRRGGLLAKSALELNLVLQQS